jgi:hypothetical protein
MFRFRPGLTPAQKKNKEMLYQTSREGMHSSGHYEQIFTDASGAEKYSEEQKMELREYLKTL